MWTLILTIVVGSSVPHVAMMKVDGFSTEQRCNEFGDKWSKSVSKFNVQTQTSIVCIQQKS